MNELLLLLYISSLAFASGCCLLLGAEALVSFAACQMLLMNLFVSKQIALFGLSLTASDALAIGSSLSLNLIQEYISQELAKKAIGISFFISFFALVSSSLHLLYQPLPQDTMHVHFEKIFQPFPRIVLASFASYLFSQYVEWNLYAFLKKRFSGRYFVARNWLSISLSQALDTLLFSFFGLWGSVENFQELLLFSYAIKLFVLFSYGPFLKIITLLFSRYGKERRTIL